MARALAVLAILWPAIGAAAVASAANGRAPLWTAGVYVVGSRICHQRPERSFHTAGIPWPVCARCSGMYLGAAVAGWVGLTAAGRMRARATSVRAVLAAAALPTLATWTAERFFDVPFSNAARFVAALPLGAVVAAIVVAVAAGTPRAHQVN
jgi:uncharacterized membrane protein